MEIGVDCVETKRFLRYERDQDFLSKVFTEKEINYCRGYTNSSHHFAARFAGKESVIKAIANYGIRLLPDQIEILNDATGVPHVTITGEYTQQYVVKISLSHSEEIAIAFALVEEVVRKA